MKTMKIKAVIITDGENYVIHGVDNATWQEMFKTVLPLWHFDPSRELVHAVEFELILPELEKPDAVPTDTI